MTERNIKKGKTEAKYTTDDHEKNGDRSSKVESASGLYSERKNSAEKERKYQRNPSPPMFDSGNKDPVSPAMYEQVDKGNEITMNSSKLTRVLKNKMEKVHTKEFNPESVKRELSTDSEDSDYESRRSLRQSIQNRLKRNRTQEG